MLTTDVLEGLELDLGDAFFGDVVPLDVDQLPRLADADVPEYFEKIGSIFGLERFQPLGLLWRIDVSSCGCWCCWIGSRLHNC